MRVTANSNKWRKSLKTYLDQELHQAFLFGFLMESEASSGRGAIS